MFKKKLLPLILATVIGCQSSVTFPAGNRGYAGGRSSNTNTAVVMAGVGLALVPFIIVGGVIACIIFCDDIFSDSGSVRPSIDEAHGEMNRVCKHGSLEEIREVLDTKVANICTSDSLYLYITNEYEGECPLYLACERGNLDIVKLLVGKIRDFNRAGLFNLSDKKTILHAACKPRNPRVFKWLVNEKVQNINSNTMWWLDYNKTPLHIAAECGREDLVRWLINQKGANKEAKTRNLKYKSVIYACKSGNKSLVKYFMEELRVDLRNLTNHNRGDGRWLLLEAACKSGNVDLVQWLVDDKGIDLYTSNELVLVNAGQRALWAALEEGKINVAQWLIAREVRYRGRLNAMLIDACEKNGGVATARFLVSKGARVQAVKNKLLKNAARQGKFDLLRYFIEEHNITNLNKQYEDSCGESDKNTLLHYACERKDKRMIAYLLDKKVRVDIKNRYKNTAFHVACNKKDLECVKLLVEKGNANIRQKGGYDDRSPLKSFLTDEKVKKYLQKRVKDN